jgi:hypothetical protein
VLAAAAAPTGRPALRASRARPPRPGHQSEAISRLQTRPTGQTAPNKQAREHKQRLRLGRVASVGHRRLAPPPLLLRSVAPVRARPFDRLCVLRFGQNSFSAANKTFSGASFVSLRARRAGGSR